MPKHTPFFKFDSSAWLGGSIQFTDLETKGLFIDLCALYWESQEPIKIDAKLRIRLRCPEVTLSNLVGTLSDLDIITQSEQGITIPFLDILLNERGEWLKRCSESGKKSKGTSSNKKEERRKKKEDIKEIKEVLEYLNLKTGKNFRTAKGLLSRLDEGYTVEDCKKVIDIKVSQWLNDPKMKKFLRPDTLFSQKFDTYLNDEKTETFRDGKYYESENVYIWQNKCYEEDGSISKRWEPLPANLGKGLMML